MFDSVYVCVTINLILFVQFFSSNFAPALRKCQTRLNAPYLNKYMLLYLGGGEFKLIIVIDLLQFLNFKL